MADSTVLCAPGYAKAYLDVPLNTLSLVDEVMRRSTTGLGVEHG